jgi:hypothetical protein
MNLHRGRRRVLREIERDLTVSDPHLAALLRLFTILVQDERMPRVEKMAGGPPGLLSRRRRRVWRRRPGLRRAGEGWRTALLTVFCGALVVVAVTSGCLYCGLGTGYPRRW